MLTDIVLLKCSFPEIDKIDVCSIKEMDEKLNEKYGNRSPCRGNKVIHAEGLVVEVRSTLGAGDAMVATLALALQMLQLMVQKNWVEYYKEILFDIERT